MKERVTEGTGLPFPVITLGIFLLPLSWMRRFFLPVAIIHPCISPPPFIHLLSIYSSIHLFSKPLSSLH